LTGGDLKLEKRSQSEDRRSELKGSNNDMMGEYGVNDPKMGASMGVTSAESKLLVAQANNKRLK